MKNRRDFLQYGLSTAAAATLPVSTIVLADTHQQLIQRRIPGTEELLPVIGLGNGEAFQSGNLDLSRELLDIFSQFGGAYVDTSGPGRYTLGRIMQERRAHDDWFLGTYVGATDANEGLRELTAVQKGQNGGSLDLVLTRNVRDFDANPRKYQRWKESGLTRYIGVARPNKSFYEIMMKFMQAKLLDFIQVNYSLFETEAADRIIPMAHDLGVAVVINRPFLNGRFFSIVRDRSLPAWAEDFDCKSWAQFSLKYIISNPAVNCVLTETSNPKHAIDNLGAGVGLLPDQKTRNRMLDYMRNLN